MKVNKWTVALAGLGLVSLASVAKAEEKASPVMTALSATTISGYVDTSAQWNFGTGNANVPPVRFNSPSKADGFNLNTVQLRVEKPLDEADWAAGYRVDLWAGPDANTLGTQSLGFGGVSDFGIRQAYVALRAPVFNGLDFKVGVFDSIIGYESIASPDNPNYTRSYGHSIEPQTHTGVLATYRFNEMVSASVGVADTVGPQINERDFNYAGRTAESYKTYMGSVALTAPESMGFLAGSTLDAGAVNGARTRFVTVNNVGVFGPQNETTYYVGATLATPVTGLRVGASFDYLDIHSLNNDTWSLAGYLHFQATEKLSFHGRAELFKDAHPDVLFGVADPTGQGAHVVAVTGTAQYDLWKNVISRLELRWDHSLNSNNLFGGTDSITGDAQAKNAWMLAANIIYKF